VDDRPTVEELNRLYASIIDAGHPHVGSLICDSPYRANRRTRSNTLSRSSGLNRGRRSRSSK